nr:tyrosine-type recombinase/integrase [Pantoea sp. Sc1]
MRLSAPPLTRHLRHRAVAAHNRPIQLRVKDFRLYTLRHTWANCLIQSGVPLSALQETGGWESIEMVRRYAHLAPNHLTEHARKVDSLLEENNTNMTQGKNQVGWNLA